MFKRVKIYWLSLEICMWGEFFLLVPWILYWLANYILYLVFKHIGEFMRSKLAKFQLIIYLLLLSCLGGFFSFSLNLVFSHAFTCHPNFSYKADVEHLFVCFVLFFWCFNWASEKYSWSNLYLNIPIDDSFQYLRNKANTSRLCTSHLKVKLYYMCLCVNISNPQLI